MVAIVLLVMTMVVVAVVVVATVINWRAQGRTPIR